MHALAEETTLWIPQSEEEKNLVRQQMNRLLETSHFRNSRRYPALFRFIVEETLAGRGEFLKERLLGIHVFDRPAGYDTATDPIVRVTIAEIRKRIAQYYHEDGHDSEMRIELLPGHYAPEFRPRIEADTTSHAWHPPATFTSLLNVGEAEVTSSAPAAAAKRTSKLFWKLMAAIAAAALVAATGGIVLWRAAHPSALNEFWKPVLSGHQNIMFCLPTGGVMQGTTPFAPDGSLKPIPPPATVAAGSPMGTFLDHEDLGENVVFSDVLATLKVSDFFAIEGHDARYKLSTVMTLDDLRQGPGVLVGGLDNQWTLRALTPLRFRFFGDEQRDFWIMDAKNPASRDWELKLDTPYSAVRHDFAIIARIHNESSGQIQIILAGIGMSATAAAGEFLVNPQHMEELRRRIGPGFRDRDFEAVLSTDVVNGMAGTPKIVAVSVP